MTFFCRCILLPLYYTNCHLIPPSYVHFSLKSQIISAKKKIVTVFARNTCLFSRRVNRHLTAKISDDRLANKAIMFANERGGNIAFSVIKILEHLRSVQHRTLDQTCPSPIPRADPLAVRAGWRLCGIPACLMMNREKFNCWPVQSYCVIWNCLNQEF